MLYATKTGRLLTDEDVNRLSAWQVEQLGIHVAENSWEEFN